MSARAEGLGQFLRVGTPAILHPDPDKADSVRLRATIRGWQPGLYIILDLPKDEAYAFKSGRRAALRFVAEGEACGCTVKVADRGAGSYFTYVRVTWPREFTSVSVRKHERVQLNVPCQVQPVGSEPFEAEICDLSTGGCRILSPQALTTGRDIELSFTLPDGSEMAGLSAIVRGVSTKRTNSYLGCKFVEDQDAIINEIDFYVTSTLESLRSGDGDELRVIVLEHGMKLANAIRPLLKESGIDTVAVTQVVDAFSLLRMGHSAALLVNQEQPELDGLTVCRCVKKTPRFEELPVFLCGTGGGDLDAQAQDAGVTACFPSIAAEEIAKAVAAQVARSGSEEASA